MLSYQHGYHAGGPADVHKHAVLAALLDGLTRKERPVTVMESHAGRGLYNLIDDMASKTGEASRGVLRLSPAAHPYWTALKAVRAQSGADAYPGSPGISRALLRKQDKLVLMELHPAEHAALKAEFAGPGVSVHRRDGREGLRALTPPDPRRGLALIDPSYEVKGEYLETAMLGLEIYARWAEGVIMIWYPIMPDDRQTQLTDVIGVTLGEDSIRDEVMFVEPPARGMIGSGVIVINPPFGANQMLDQAHRICAPVLAPRAEAVRQAS